MLRRSLIALLVLLTLPALFIAYVFLDNSLIQPFLHDRNTKRGQSLNADYLSGGQVQIHQLAYLVEVSGQRIKVQSELACAQKWKTAEKTFKAPGYSRLRHFGLNTAEVRFPISDTTDYIATPRAEAVCHLVANLERDLPIVLQPYLYDVSVAPTLGPCPQHADWLTRGAGRLDFGPLQVRSTRTVPVAEVFSAAAFAPDAVDTALDPDPDMPVPDRMDHIDTLDQNRCS